MKRLALGTTALLIVVSGSVALRAADTIAGPAVTAAWQEDARALADALRDLHPEVDWITPREAFDWQVEQTLHAVTAAKTDEARIVALMEMIAAVRDGHTVLDSSSRYEELGWLPFSAVWYADGIIFRRLPKPRAEALGGRILSVDGLPIELVLERLRRVVPHATTPRFRRWAPSYLHLPGLLYGLGLTDSPDVAKFEVALRDGKVTTLEFKRTPEEVEDEIEFVSWDSRLADKLLRYREPDRLYRLEGLPEHRALYVGYRRIGVDEQENPWLFASRLVDYINTHDDVDRLIVDLRDNGGGGYQYVAHLGPMLAGLPRINRPGGLYVLIGQRTFSAAIGWANWLRLNTAAIFVGQPAGDRPISPGDDDPFTLPHSGLVVNISRKHHDVTFPGDRREEWQPDIAVAETARDLFDGRDAALEVALHHRVGSAPAAAIDESWLGRYDFDLDADLVFSVESGQLVATVTPRMRMILRQDGRSRFASPIEGLTFTFDAKGRSVTMATREGTGKELARLPEDRRTAWELFLDGRYDEAEKAFREVISAHPDHPPLSDGALVSEAIHLVFRVRPEVGEEASRKVGAELLRMCLRLLPEGAPDCEFSLRFYE